MSVILSDIVLPSEGYEQAEILAVRFFHKENRAVFMLRVPEFPVLEATLDLEHILQEKLKTDVVIRFESAEPCRSQTEAAKYIEYCSAAEDALHSFSNAPIRFEQEERRIVFLYDDDASLAEASAAVGQLAAALADYGFAGWHMSAEKHETETIEVRSVEMPKPAAVKAPQPARRKHRGKGRRDRYAEITLSDITDQMRDVQFEGEVFKDPDNFVIRATGKTIQSLYVYDGHDAVTVKRFEGNDCPLEELNKVKNGDRCRFYGSVSYDTYAKDLVFNAEEVEILPPQTVCDEAPEKRIELHAHTNMSEMDGVCSASDIVEYAYGLGHDGIVITDHADVQSFVKAFNAASSLNKKHPERWFKVGLGCEVNLANDHLNIVYNSTDQDINDLEYVVYDLETTGLSCKYDSIIEFGAVKVSNGMTPQRIQMFIKPPQSIPAYITGKTKITNDMVRNAKPFAEAAKVIVEWIGDAVLVAHNASFDYYFLNEELRRAGYPELKNPVIDTLDLSRALLTERRAYRLGNIARNYGISYDEEVAHRADYDAETLASVFQSLLRDAQARGVRTLNDLQWMVQDENAYRKVRRSHTVLLAKNAQGLKDLYRLVSESNTKTLYVVSKGASKDSGEVTAEPRVLRSSVEKVRENLLIGTSCQNNEVFELACNADDARLETAMSWYDYVEIQPLSVYSTFVALQNVPSLDRLKMVIRRIIQTAQKLGIPVVADSDAHYCSPKQKIFRDVYIMSQGVGGVPHPLYIRDDMLRQKTKNPDQHIRLTDEMLDEFRWLNDDELVHRMVIEEPRRIFDQLEEIRPVPAGTFPPMIEGSDEKLRSICYGTARSMYEYNGKLPEIVENRLKQELDIIINDGFGVHYYIAHLLVKKSNDDGYMVGSRGSVGSSFTATMAGITEVNPLIPHYRCPHCHHTEFFDDPKVKSGYDLPDKVCPECGHVMKGDGQNIPFQTFLTKGKTPDIDLNFSNEYQAKAHAFIRDVFGEAHAYRAGTIGTIQEKTAYGYVSGYCEKMGITDMRRVMRDYLAQGCQEVKRTTGQHPGGIIIIPEEYEAEDFTPVQYPANDPNSEWKTTHYDFHDIHDNVLKFDILGHVDPTAMRLLQRISDVKPQDIPMNDPETLSLFYSDDALKADPRVYHKETGALGLPEFGTKITRRTLEDTRPKLFSELVMISGLSHGTDVWAGNAEVLIKQGHPLDEVIACRDDIMTYLMEQGLVLNDAFRIMEDVRKGRGLKEEQEKLMKEHQVPDWYIESCKKIKYMFPKAHAVAYVMMAVRIAWYKVHEPQNFYIQYLSLRCDAYEIETMTRGLDPIRQRMTDISERMNNRFAPNAATNKERALYNTLEVCEELYARGFRIANVDLYKSDASIFKVDEEDDHVIIPPFTVVDGLGVNVARSIVEARNAGPFLSKEDVLKRTQLSAAMLKKLEQMGSVGDLQELNQLSLF
ncbi:MAG: PolC-type DNA polymerase III [Solobacterium sp.]|nr:PolC-type DNA polymerase III [Solobacterium sp.]